MESVWGGNEKETRDWRKSNLLEFLFILFCSVLFFVECICERKFLPHNWKELIHRETVCLINNLLMEKERSKETKEQRQWKKIENVSWSILTCDLDHQHELYLILQYFITTHEHLFQTETCLKLKNFQILGIPGYACYNEPYACPWDCPLLTKEAKDFHKTWFEHHGIKDYTIFLWFNKLATVVPTYRHSCFYHINKWIMEGR
jgi:hypothetical protein